MRGFITLLGALSLAATTGCVIQLNDPFDQELTESTSRFEPLPDGLTDLTLEVPAGDVTVVAGPDLGIDVELRWHSNDDEPRIVSEEIGTVATKTWSCRGTRGCTVDLTVTVPDDLASLDLDLDAGSIVLTDLTGELSVDLDAGDIEIRGHQGDVDVLLDAGSLDATNLVSDDVRAVVDAGDLDVTIAERPESVSLEADAGDIDLVVPAGAYAIDARATVGNVNIDASITDDGNADASIRADADVGSIRISGS